MNHVAETVAAFGRSIGFDDLQLRDQGALVLGLDTIGILAIERTGNSGESIVISLARRLHRPDELNLSALLGRAHFRHRLSQPIRVGLLRDDVVMSVVFPLEEFTLSRLHESIRLLDEEQEKVEALR